MEKERPQPRPDPGPTDEVEGPRLGLNRCPYCHDDLVVGEERSFACERCLARHHPACWRESGACGACGSEEHMVPAPSQAARERRGSGVPREAPAGRRRADAFVLAVSMVTIPLLLAGGGALYRVVSSPTVRTVDDVRALEDALELKAEGLELYSLWSAARAAGADARAQELHGQALERLQAAAEALNAVLDKPVYRGDDGFLKPEYEGYEEELSEIARHLVDLEKAQTLR